MDGTNRYLKKTFLPRHNRQFSSPAKESKTAYTRWVGIKLDEILCVATHAPLPSSLKYFCFLLENKEKN